ncbi:polysaccharide deacetylase family protein [Tenggerimyces flavus]|uniref:Polysaccharide deacetylase family protein n=1 Tax=Tenggerimyces flavus TaxID=1708749 RepID=A0ABV7Y224_9ACTN|nr:polysaccharide deacetylase family protein [Tenggerimyces flavus]MBM7790843.1 putative glycoside hydrolase/deacetylase ChbG (UPF0249 family) [Tenggerimyces flavus]
MTRLSSELLGFAPDDRVLLVNCDDFGMHDAVNRGIIDALENGIASSCSLMTPCPAAADAMTYLRARPDVSFGIHFSLIRDSAEYYWEPLADDVPSLLDPATGELFVDSPANRQRLLAQARLSDVERELRAQLQIVLDAGLKPTHLDWHCLADGGRPDILALAVSLAAEHGLAARVWLDEGLRLARAEGKPVVDHGFLDSFSLELDDKSATYERLLRSLKPGLTEWAIHPAIGTEEWQEIEPGGWRVRQTDHDFLTSARAREVLDEERIKGIDYRPLQQAWASA